jgi:hypothetical protein
VQGGGAGFRFGSVRFFLNSTLALCAGKKWHGFGNFVPEFFIDAGARGGKISALVHNFI